MMLLSVSTVIVGSALRLRSAAVFNYSGRNHRLLHAIWTTLAMVLLLGAAVQSAHAADTLVLRQGTGHYIPHAYLGYLKDEAGRLTLDEVRRPALESQFRYIFKNPPNFGFTRAAYWFRIDLENRDAPVTEWLLESQAPLLDEVDVYFVHPDGGVVALHSGDTLPFAARALKHRNMVFKLPLAPGQRVTAFIHVRTESSLQLPLGLWSPSAFLAKDHEEQIALGAYYGILLALFCYNLMLFLSTRDRNFLYYLHYIGAWFLFQLSLNGLAFEYLWPEYPNWGNRATPFFIGVALVGVMQFTRSFLKLATRLPRFNLICLGYLWIGVAIAVGTLFLPYYVVVLVCNAATLTAAVVIFVAGILTLRRGLRQARYFMLAWTVLLVSAFAYVLKQVGVLPTLFLTEYGMQIGSSLEVILLSFALAHRMTILKEENERIQREARELLEQRVERRTVELGQALRNLSAANEKLQEMSDLDALTGVKNRACFNKRLEAEWARALRSGTCIGMMMLDIDHFKMINDTFGHLGGDVCLKRLADTVRRIAQRPADDTFRYGGEEFIVLLPGTTIEGVMHIAETMRAEIERLDIAFDDRRISLTTSIGAASIVPAVGTSSESLVRLTDEALYKAKHNGRNRIEMMAPRPHMGSASLAG